MIVYLGFSLVEYRHYLGGGFFTLVNKGRFVQISVGSYQDRVIYNSKKGNAFIGFPTGTYMSDGPAQNRTADCSVFSTFIFKTHNTCKRAILPLDYRAYKSQRNVMFLNHTIPII